MAKTGKKKYYVVWEGLTPGIYGSWPAAQAQVKGYPGARYQAFATEAEARQAFHQGAPVRTAVPKGVPKPTSLPENAPIVWESICVDAACSGNPGKMEYRGVDTRTGYQFFHQAFPLGTNNIGEFLAIVHGLAMLQKKGSQIPVYSDSRNAIKWVRAGKCKTTLVRNAKTASLFSVIERAETWLAQHTFSNPLLKWETEEWGEIPADFGRK
ncbi:MAG: viroplasmin family protein [Saprospirales bacterium]|nr:viroplasmin family protein [Saprospirales bacterium]MBK8491174.1 viroplasmin family protein [Saprospirales bacterium]